MKTEKINGNAKKKGCFRRENLKTHCRPTIAKWKFLVENSPIKYFLVKVRDRLICLKLGPVRRRLKSLLSINKAHSFET